MRNNILQSIPFWAAFFGVTLAQIIKPFINFIASKEFKPSLMLANGGMPSSHTSGICSFTAAIGFTNGFASDLFVLSLVISLIVMNDAMNVRLETGRQAEVINQWSEIFQELFSDEGFTRQQFKTMVGHTVLQVFWGMIFGVIIGTSTYFILR